MNTVTVTLGSLVDQVLDAVQDPASVPYRVALYDTITDSATTLQLADAQAAVKVSDLLEFGTELILVTAKSTDALPVYTVSRGYYGTTAAAHSAGAAGYANPPYARRRVAEAIKKCFSRLEGLGVPLVETDTFGREEGMQYVVLPAETRQVLRVGYMDTKGWWHDMGRWSFVDDVPTDIVTTGKMLRIPSYWSDDDEMHITYQIPYRWSTHPAVPTEAATISMIEGTEDLPVLYAVAWLLRGREVSRQNLAAALEWNQGEPSRNGQSAALLRLQWQEFYRAIDEAKRLVPSLPIHRPYVPRPRL